MKRIIPLSLLSLSFALVACAPGARQVDQSLLDNPLFALWYYEQIQQNMMSLQIQNSPLLQDAAKKSAIEQALRDATRKVQDVEERHRKGLLGNFVLGDQIVQGQALLLDGKLHLSPDFSIMPGPSVHIYLSPSLDPRVGELPGKDSIDLGVLRNPYGTDTYDLQGKDTTGMRSVVIYDTSIGSLYGFAQLQTQ